jgi:lipoyl(octanoyl) transferase
MARAFFLGRRRYAEMVELQNALFRARKAGDIEDTLLLLEHEPVVTMGRGAKAANLLAPEERLRELGIDLCWTDRGGDITLHAPGQLVAYPIVELGPGKRDVRRYVRSLIATMCEVTRRFGVDGGLYGDRVGLWVDRARLSSFPDQDEPRDPAKLGAIGVRISRWVTMHGFALNLDLDMSLYQHIVPCGISDLPVTSLETLVGRAPSVADAAELSVQALGTHLGLTPTSLEDRSAAALDSLFPSAAPATMFPGD